MESSRRKSPVPLILSGLVGFVVLIIILVASLSGDGPRGAPKSERVVETPPPRPVREPVVAPPPKPAPAPAPRPRPRPKPAELTPAEKRKREREMARTALETQTRSRLAREEFGAALRGWEEARDRFDGPEWKAEVGRRLEEIRKEAARLYEGLKKQADGRKDALVGLKTRATKWGLPAYVEELEKLVNPPMSEALKAYRAAWNEAVALAARRRYAAAIEKLEAASKGVEDADVRKEAEADVAFVREAQAAYGRALGEAASTEAGTAIELAYVHRPGDVREVNGYVVRADGQRAEIRTADDKTVFLDWADLTADSVVAFLGKGEGKALLVLEGDPLGEAPSARYAAHGKAVRGKVPVRDGREYEARDLLHAAEGDWADPARRGEAIGKYVRLREEYGSTAVVKGSADRVAARSEAGKEVVIFPSEAKAGGEFAASEAENLAFVWTNARDLGEEDDDSYVEAAFHALPDATYQAWAYVGGCCRETFAFYYQTTGATARDPKDRNRRISLDPGAADADLVRHRVPYLKRTHVSHGGPKQPARWDWVRIPLPEKYTVPGRKVIRLLSDQKGFSVAFILVSSVRSKPPGKDETAELAGKLAGKKDVRPLVLSRPTVKSGRGGGWYEARPGEKIYADRAYTLVTVPPALKKSRALRMANDDKMSKGSDFIVFEASRDVTVYVAHDGRVTPKPAWLASFKATGDRIELSESTMPLYVRSFPAGRVSLGGNQTKDENSTNMYLVFVVPAAE